MLARFRDARGERIWPFVRTDEDRVDAAGVVWTRHFLRPDTKTLSLGAADPECVGTWQVHAPDGTTARVELLANGHAGGEIGGLWAVRDGVLLVQACSPRGGAIDWEITALLSPDRTSFEGRRTHDGAKLSGTKSRE